MTIRPVIRLTTESEKKLGSGPLFFGFVVSIPWAAFTSKLNAIFTRKR